MLYFAYGSNMYWPQIKSRCPSAEFFRVARLKDHRLAFTRRSVPRGCGSADVVPEQGQDVWGVVFEIDETEIVNLDRAEDYMPGRLKNGYTRQRGAVHVEGERLQDPHPGGRQALGSSPGLHRGARKDRSRALTATVHDSSPWKDHDTVKRGACPE